MINYAHLKSQMIQLLDLLRSILYPNVFDAMEEAHSKEELEAAARRQLREILERIYREPPQYDDVIDTLFSKLPAIRDNATRLMHRLNVELCGHDDAYRAALRELCPGCEGFIREPFRCDYGLNISIGEGSFVNFDCVFLDLAPIRIGRHTLIGPKVQLLTALHPFDAAQRRTGLEAGRPITVGDDCWLGGGVIVCPGVAIGDRSVIGAGAVVTRDIPADSVAVGNPARVIRTLTRQDETE